MSQQLTQSAPATPEPDVSTSPDTGCEQGRDNRQSDLCAQWKAADAAFNSAQSTAEQVLIGWIGIVLGAVTMSAAIAAAWYARRAATATEATVGIAADAARGAGEALAIAARNADAAAEQVKVAQDTAEKQLRPYLLFGPVSVIAAGQAGSFSVYQIAFRITNTGSTPAYVVSAKIGRQYFGHPQEDYESVAMNTAQFGGVFISQNESEVLHCAVSEASLFRGKEPMPHGPIVHVLAHVVYRGMSDPEDTCYTSIRGRIIAFSEHPGDEWGPGQIMHGEAENLKLDKAT